MTARARDEGNSKMKTQFRNIAPSLLLALAGVACSPSVGTIDRTQPNALDKEMFSGLWYYKATVIDSDPSAGDAVDGYASGMDKLRWEITRDLLVGYRSYEFIPYAEGKTDQGRDFFGAPVVAYKILGHFDIQRDYNKTTGVENNVIVENSTDRPWHERRYFRVDWTQNVVGGITPFQIGFTNYPDAYFAGTSILAYYDQANEETNPNRPFITKNYFDVTNEYHVEPDDYYCYLMLLYNGVPRCGATRVRARLSFQKVDPANDFQSLYYPDNVELKDDSGNVIATDFSGRKCDGSDGHRDPADCEIKTFPVFEAFGNFRTERVAFDHERFMTRTGRIYLAGRFDLWNDSYNDMTGKLIPYPDRTPKPVVYYGNTDFPEDLIGSGKQLAASWTVPFDETVAFLQGMKTPDGRGDRNALKSKYGADFQMFQFRQNDCNVENIRKYASDHNLTDVVDRVAGSLDKVARGNIEKVCAAVQYAELKRGATLDPVVHEKTGAPMAFIWEREGDSRFNFQNYVDPDNAGPWGVAQFGTDPETGEFVSNAANYFGNAGDWISQREADRLQWLNGDLDAQSILRGDVARNAVVSRRTETNKKIRSDVKAAMMASDADLVAESGDSLFANPATGSEEDRAERMFKGTDIERELLVTDEILRGFAGPSLYQPDSPVQGGSVSDVAAIAGLGAPAPGTVTDEAIKAASPVSWGVGLEKNGYMTAVRELARRGVEMADFFDPVTSGLADYYKGKDNKSIYQDLRYQLYAAVEAHEVGHTVGLRHNFGASMDPLNYIPDFWEKGYWSNPPTKENPNRGLEMKYASLMDYGFGVSTEGLHGVGPYDAAAVRFMYGQLMDVWNPAKISVPDARRFGSYARRCGHDSTGFGADWLIAYINYTSIPSVVSSAPSSDDNNLSPIDSIFKKFVARVEANAASQGDRSGCTLTYSDLNWLLAEVQKLEPHPENVFGARMLASFDDLVAQEKATILNHPEYDDPSTTADESADGVDQDGDSVPDDRGVDYATYLHRVPYEFCPDEYAGYSPGCQLWDTGANFLEGVDAHITAYDRDYIFDGFRRDRYASAGWGNPRSYMANLQSRRLFHMTNVFRYYLYSRNTPLNAPLFDQWAEAAYHGANFLERMLQAPEPGNYCLDSAKNMYVPLSQLNGPCPAGNELTLGLGYGQGRYFNTAWTNEYDYKANRIGNFYDKLAAMREMTSSSGSFIRDYADLFDRRAFSLGYLRAWEDPIIQRMSGLIRGDFNGYRPAVVVDDQTGEKYVRYTPFFDEELADGTPVRQWLDPMPKIEPTWSWTLQFYALYYSIANFSSINDASPEFYRFTKIAIKGTPEDIEYPNCVDRGTGSCVPFPIVEFTDPESAITYRAPDIASRAKRELVPSIKAYAKPNSWGIGAEILKTANTIKTNDYMPAQADCTNLTGSAKDEACRRFDRARKSLNETIGFIDIIRRFNRRAELP